MTIRRTQAKNAIREYGDEFPVEIIKDTSGRWCIRAYNEGGYCATYVDLVDLLEWLNVLDVIPYYVEGKIEESKSEESK